MNRTNARKLITSLDRGPELDALVCSLVLKSRVYPLFYWDTCLGVGKVYPFTTSRFRLMRCLDRGTPNDSSIPLYLYDYSFSLDTADEIMQELDISVGPSKNHWRWTAKSGKYQVTHSIAPVAVCQVALLKVLKL